MLTHKKGFCAVSSRSFVVQDPRRVDAPISKPKMLPANKVLESRWRRRRCLPGAQVTFLLVMVQLLRISVVQACQFHLSGDNKLFERVPENLTVGSEIKRITVHPRGSFTVEPASDSREDVVFVSYKEIDDKTVALVVARSLENLVDQAQPKSVLKFQLSCKGPNSTETVSLPVNLYIQDVNDHSPEFQNAPYFVEVDELTPIGLTIFRGIHAKDGDKPNTANSEVSYSIIGGNSGDTFTLSDPMEGNVVVAKPLDYDSGAREYKLEIQAQDHGTPVSHSSITFLTIKVRDSDDQNPAFTKDIYRARVNEKWTITGQPIRERLIVEPRIHAEDLDRAINATLRYSILAGNEDEIFAVEPKDGSVYLTREIDREQLAINLFSLQLQAVQENNPIRQAKARLDIEVVDVNDNQPIFEADLYNVTVMENLPNGFSVVQVRAQDEDVDDNAEFRFRLQDESGAFEINDVTGWITVKDQSKLDREKFSLLTFKVFADEKTPSVFGNIPPSSTTVEVYLMDSNDNNPKFVPSNIYHFNISELATPGTIVGSVSAIDIDQEDNGKVFYFKQNDSFDGAQHFGVHRENGSIYVVDSLTTLSARSPTYNLFVVAADMPVNPSERRTSLAMVQISTEDVNNNPPHVLSPRQASVGENLPAGTPVMTVVARDIDADTTLSFNLYSESGAVPFTINNQSGLITTTQELDYEETTDYTLMVEVGDGKFIVRTPLVINVIDVNDHVPTFSQSSYNFTVLEEDEPGLIIGTVQASDGDHGINGEISYGILGLVESSSFGIGENGTVYTLRRIDREREKSFIVTLVVFDRGIPSLSSTATALITVDDVNDNAPRFGIHTLEMAVPEELPPPVSIVTVNATDIDDDENSKIIYYFTAGNDNGIFSINETSGEITAQKPLDYETSQRYVLNVTAANDRPYEGPIQPNLLASTIQVIVNVEDRNDDVPVFERNRYVYAFPESQRTPEVIGLVNAVNQSSSHPQKIVYWTNPGELPAKMKLNSDTGEILLMEMVDRDPPSNEMVFNFEVYARDTLSINSGNASTNITIFTTDVNDNSPKFEQDFYQVQVPEDMPVGAVLNIVLNATDKDDGANGEVGLYRLNGTNMKFSMGNTSGIIILSEPLDYEDESRYSYEVLATDRGDPPRTGTATLIVNVLNINEHPPEFDNTTYELWAGENLGSGTQVGQIHARDLDGNTVVYSLVRGDIEFFDIDETTGKLYTKGDTSVRPDYSLVVMAIDDGQPKPLSSSADVIIHVKEANNHPPVFSQPVYDATVREKDESGAVIIQVTATDNDILNNNVTYTIADGNSNGLFVIDELSGEIRVNPTHVKDLDYDIQNSHTLVVEAKDAHERPRMGVAMVKITVVDTNNHPPKFSKTTYEASVLENQKGDHCFLQVQAKSGDTVDFVAYSLDNFGSLFRVDSNSGQLCAIKPLDREAQAFYALTVKATDGKFNSFATVKVAVMDENDNAPRFERERYELTIPADLKAGSHLVTLNAIDPDEAYNGQVTYFATNNYGLFEVDYATGKVKLLRGFGANVTGDMVYMLDVLAQDHGAEARTGRTRLLVHVSTRGGHKPIFDRFVYSLTLPEQVGNTPFLKVNAHDQDEEDVDKIRYRVARQIGSGNRSDGADFRMDPKTGELYLSNTLDYSVSRFHQVEIETYNEGEELVASSSIVQIKVLNTNNHAPEFYPFPSVLRIPVSRQVGETIFRVQATDKDDLLGQQKITYSFEPEQSMLSLNPDTGDVIIERRLLPLVRNITVIARDGGEPPLENEATLAIDVYDEKAPRMQSYPMFEANQFIRVYRDRLPGGFPLVQVQAAVPSGDPITFALGGSAETVFKFGINPDTGLVFTRQPLNRSLSHIMVIAYNKLFPQMFNEAVLTVEVIAPSTACPEFTFPEYRASIPESAPPGMVVLEDLQVEQPEIFPEMQFKIMDDQSQGSFFLVAKDNVAELRLQKVIDRERMSSQLNGMYKLVISLSNNNCTRNTTVKVNVEDVNDNNPKFSKTEYEAHIKENSPNDEEVITLKATDADDMDHGKLRYQIVDGNEDGYFAIDEKTGVITSVVSLDREMVNSYQLIVSVTDTDNNTGSARVLVKVDDVNDERPKFLNQTAFLVTKEGPQSLSAKLILEAVDNDISPNSDLEFYIIQGNEENEFLMKTIENKGVFSVRQELDRDAYETEDAAVRHVVVGVKDKGTPSLSSSALVTVIIDDINDQAPEFDQDEYHELITEGVPVGHNITQVKAVDRDSAQNTQLVYSLESGIRGEDLPFIIDNTTGVISVSRILDFSEKSEYNITLIVSDGLHVSQGKMKIYVTEAVERQPRMERFRFDFRVEENKIGEKVGQINLGQPRSGLRRPIGFRIVNEEAQEFFTISPDGTLYTKIALDREKRETYTFTVVQEDKKLPRRMEVCEVNVIIEDVNDEAPTFSRSYKGIIPENSPPGTIVKIDPAISATDKDLNVNSVVQYSLLSDGLDIFDIDPMTGQVMLSPVSNATLDREFIPQYSLKVKAYDLFNLSSTTNLTIVIEDENDNSPEFLHGDQTLDILETTPVNTRVAQVVARDDDGPGPNSAIAYTIVNGTQDKFKIDKESGEIFLASSVSPETTFSLRIAATDGGGRSAYARVHIHVIDVNNHSPQFTKTDYFFRVPEGRYATQPHVLGRLAATDADFGKNAEMEYAVVSTQDDGWPFAIDAWTGHLNITRDLDRETLSSYSFIVMALDQGEPQLTATATVSVEVLDVNDEVPRFINDPYYAAVPENQKPGQFVVQVRAYDLDSNLTGNGRIFFKLEEGHDNSFFIDSKDGTIWTLTTLDYETRNRYNISVIAYDQGQPSLSASTMIYVNVTDRKDVVPHFAKAVFMVEVAENVPPGTVVYRLDAGPERFTYHIIDEDLDNTFSLEPNTGEITLLRHLDSERKSQYRLLVRATDHSEMGSNNDTAEVILVVTTGPALRSFPKRQYEVEVLENLPAPIVFLDLNASDESISRRVEYSIVSNNYAGLFTIDPVTGQLSVTKSLDREENDEYFLKIRGRKTNSEFSTSYSESRAQDRNDLAADETMVLIHVGDENDNAPEFESRGRAIVAAVPVEASFGYSILTVKARDLDAGVNASIRYEIVQKVEDDGRFHIDSATGEITALVPLALDGGKVFSFDVKATDMAGSKDGKSSYVNVYIYVIPDNKLVVLTVGEKPLVVEENVNEVVRDLSNATGYDVKISKIEPHIEDDLIDRSSTDMFLYAVDPATNTLVDLDRFMKTLNDKETALQQYIAPYKVGSFKSVVFQQKSSQFSVTEMALLAFGGIIFLAAVIGIFFACLRHHQKKKNGAAYPAAATWTETSKPYSVKQIDRPSRSSYAEGSTDTQRHNCSCMMHSNPEYVDMHSQNGSYKDSLSSTSTLDLQKSRRPRQRHPSGSSEAPAIPTEAPTPPRRMFHDMDDGLKSNRSNEWAENEEMERTLFSDFPSYKGDSFGSTSTVSNWKRPSPEFGYQ